MLRIWRTSNFEIFLPSPFSHAAFFSSPPPLPHLLLVFNAKGVYIFDYQRHDPNSLNFLKQVYHPAPPCILETVHCRETMRGVLHGPMINLNPFCLLCQNPFSSLPSPLSFLIINLLFLLLFPSSLSILSLFYSFFKVAIFIFWILDPWARDWKRIFQGFKISKWYCVSP